MKLTSDLLESQAFTSHTGYFRMPALHDEFIVFISEDDVWRMSLKTKHLFRLTTGLGECSYPCISPDGKWVAFTGRDEGHSEVYLIPLEGGEATRLTYLGASTRTVGWKQDEILFLSSARQPFKKILHGFRLHYTGGEPIPLSLGHLQSIQYLNSTCVISRGTADTARWKRYKGGTSGDIWIDRSGEGQFEPFSQRFGFLGNFVSPQLIDMNGDTRVFFLSDHDGVANVYSATLDAREVMRHTEQTDFFARALSRDASGSSRMVYHAGGKLFRFDAATGINEEIEIPYRSQRTQRNRKFVSLSHYLDSYALSHQGNHLAATSRGKSLYMHLSGGPVLYLGDDEKRSYGRERLTTPLFNAEYFVSISDASGEEVLTLYSKENHRIAAFPEWDLGRVISIIPSPTRYDCAVINHRQELLLLSLNPETPSESRLKLIAKSEYNRILLPSFSPNGNYLAYALPISHDQTCIEIADIQKGESHRVTVPILNDFAPQFSKDGQYLFFLSKRIFNPVYDQLHLDLNFPKAIKPYLITLHKDKRSPFWELSDFSKSQPSDKPIDPPQEKKDSETSTQGENVHTPPIPAVRIASASSHQKAIEKPIDFEGIEHRVVEFPVPEGRYGGLFAVKSGILLWEELIIGANSSDPSPGARLQLYRLEQQKFDLIADGVTHWSVSGNGEVLVYGKNKQMHAVGISELPDNKPASSRKTVDLASVKIKVTPTEEWVQMFREAWRLQRDQFWNESMSGIEWLSVYRQYFPLVSRVNSRAELSDVIWEMQGELGTSHCYEWGGDYRLEPNYPLGFLGAQCAYDTEENGFKILSIPKGDVWKPGEGSPLMAPGAQVSEGDIITTVNGIPLSESRSLGETLMSLAGKRVTLTVKSPGSDKKRTVEVMTLKSEELLYYRDWVVKNREQVKKHSNGRLGYVHVPNMQAWGYAEFYRAFLTEYKCDGLIIDVRFNGGGHVSEVLLEKLMRKRLGYDVSRWSKEPAPYFSLSPTGPMVALTNEFAGSDGDIFSHSFKMLGLGKLIGKRTWGGVVGIFPRHSLSDGTVTTQPEFSFWFKDVGWQIENYGTDPDIVVERTPQEYAQGKDTQLEVAIDTLLEQLRQSPPFKPEFHPLPNLAPPHLTAEG